MSKHAVRFALAAAALLGLAGGITAQTVTEGTGIPEKSYKSWSPMPIIMYDGDIGVGYGGKVKLVDFLGKKESFDLILFNSSKGERWYVFTFSLPDIEIRQGRTYPISVDVKAEYDKYLSYTYYGVGPDSLKDNMTTFTHTTKTLTLTLGHGFSPHFAVEVSYALRGLTYMAAKRRPAGSRPGAASSRPGTSLPPSPRSPSATTLRTARSTRPAASA